MGIYYLRKIINLTVNNFKAIKAFRAIYKWKPLYENICGQDRGFWSNTDPFCSGHKLTGRQRAVRVRARLAYVVRAEANRRARGVARGTSAREWHREEPSGGSTDSGLIPTGGYPSEGALRAKTKKQGLSLSSLSLVCTSVAVFISRLVAVFLRQFFEVLGIYTKRQVSFYRTIGLMCLSWRLSDASFLKLNYYLTLS